MPVVGLDGYVDYERGDSCLHYLNDEFVTVPIFFYVGVFVGRCVFCFCGKGGQDFFFSCYSICYLCLFI